MRAGAVRVLSRNPSAAARIIAATSLVVHSLLTDPVANETAGRSTLLKPTGRRSSAKKLQLVLVKDTDIPTVDTAQMCLTGMSVSTRTRVRTEEIIG